jgi:palmitoyltransferase ZDHHC9/14/18
MASSDEAGRSATPGSVEAAPAIRRSDVPRPPSLVSSRMTDIGSDDGGEHDNRNQSATERRTSGLATSEGISRPGTARTGLSSGARGYTPAQPLRRQLSGKRGSVAGSVASSAQGRPPSSTTRSHVPSLTSHAFFHPLSSQRLQAQRGAARSTNLTRPHEITSAPAQEPTDDGARDTPTPPSTGAHIVQQREGDGDARAPPSRGTEVTEQEASDRITANTSPTRGHYPTGSLTESVRPLQKRPGEGLTVDTDKTYKSNPGVPTPVKTPRSFKTSFRLPNRKTSADREMQGGEKLASNPTSPDFPLGQVQKPTRGFTDKRAVAKAGTARNYNYQYFEGNTVFCLGGRLQNTKHRPVNIATGLLVVIPCVLFFIFSAPWIWYNISPAIPITFAYVFYVCISSFLHGSGSDPGVSSPLSSAQLVQTSGD